jgi:hypothetical protein
VARTATVVFDSIPRRLRWPPANKAREGGGSSGLLLERGGDVENLTHPVPTPVGI